MNTAQAFSTAKADAPALNEAIALAAEPTIGEFHTYCLANTA